MDFIERLFGASPDGGNGALELLWLAEAAVAVPALVFRRRIGAWLASRTAPHRD